ncbi:MAG: hypothetical protein EWM50_07960, partial [Gottschalkiaceae bacterium]
MYWASYLKSLDAKDYDTITISNVDYVKKDDILRQNKVTGYNQEQTKEAFAFKWSKRDTYESESVKKVTYEWLLNKYFDGKSERIKEYIKDGTKMLDAGCGSGLSASLLFKDYFS